MTRTPPTAPGTREKLIATAMDLFVHQGYGATGIAQILTHADVNAGSLYHFFPTKEDLLLATLEERKRLLWPEVLQPIWDRNSDPIERVFGLMDGYRQMLLLTEFRHGCPIGNLALELGESHPQVRKTLAELFDLWQDAVRDCFVAAAGRLPVGCDARELANFVLITMEGAVMVARTHRTIEPYDTAVTRLRDYVERLLRDGTDWAQPRSPRARTLGTGNAEPGRARRRKRPRHGKA